MEAAIVIQGVHYGDPTRLVIEQFLEKNPGVLLIVSTYEKQRHLLNDREEQLQREGKVVYIFSQPPPESDVEFWKTNHANQNLQRYTSYIGLRRARELGLKYALKVRSDVFLGMSGLIQHLIGLLDAYPGRIVVSSHATISHPDVVNTAAAFHIRDHWYFGLTEALLTFFDLDSPTWNGGRGMENCSPESSLTRVWMTDRGIKATSIDELLGKHFIVEDYDKVEQCRTHVIDPQQAALWVVDMPRYRREGRAYVSAHLKWIQNDNLSTTHEQWKSFMRQYTGSPPKIGTGLEL